jgi:metal-responsive CopG/Arc/MetJ family transcriptional regulator
MRILVDLADRQIEELDALAVEGRRSRASVLREAVATYLSAKRNTAAKIDAFGLWKEMEVDGLDYQEKLRSEW